jgi:hypothetical protein
VKASVVLGVVVAAVVALPSSAAAAPPPAPPDPSCSPGPAECGAWHNGDVTVSWAPPPAGVAASGCESVTISSDTSGTPVSCTWANADGARTTTILVRRDASPPSVSVVPERGPDGGGDWYIRPIRFEFSGDDGTSGVAACTSAAVYGGPDTGSASVSGSCTDNAGNSRSASHSFRYDATPPAVEPRPDRRPNAKGWYNRAVTVAFVGSDAVSGVDACTSPVTYSGPDAPKATITGTCRDKATNQSAPKAFELKYDTRPPVLGRVRAEIRARGIALRWQASKDTDVVVVLRRPGLRSGKPSKVYSGKRRAFTDRRLRNGVKYRYTVTAYDEAGNAAVKGLAAKYTGKTGRVAATRPAATKPALLRPAAGARVAAPIVLSWTSVRNATYYNVQVYRNGRKILTAWPSTSSFRLERSWKFEGRRHRLTPGTYRWYVWPGFGRRSENRYGALLGTRQFVVRR